jgi:adhesin transport system outer membrane protein
VNRSAAISASIEMLRSARALATVRESAFQPTVQARVRSGGGKNFDGVRDQSRDSSAEIVLNWNLFSGGADRARVRQQANVVNQAADLRDKACRDARQVVAIAYNDTRKLADQLLYLDRNTLAIEKARDAYRQQFDIGQRSLLDLLNSENELYTAKRSYANAEYDLGIAYARTQASVSRLGAQLGLTRGEGAPEAPAESDHWAVGEDGPTRCPGVAIEMETIDLGALNKRAAGIATAAPVAPIAAPPASSTPPPQVAATQATPATAGANSPARLSVRRLNDWAAAWEAKDVSRYMSFYAPSFTSARGNTAAWKANRRELVGKKGNIGVKLEDIQTKTLSADRVETSFRQTYRSANFNDQTTKTLTWQQIDGQWFIVKESNR